MFIDLAADKADNVGHLGVSSSCMAEVLRDVKPLEEGILHEDIDKLESACCEIRDTCSASCKLFYESNAMKCYELP